MLTYQQYHRQNIPEVHFDISNEEHLEEQLSIPHYADYIGPAETSPTALGYVPIPGTPSIYSHKDKPGFFHFGGSNKPTHHASLDEAWAHHDAIVNSQEQNADVVGEKLTKHYEKIPLNEHEKTALSQYTDAGSRLNSRILTRDVLDSDKNQMHHMDNALKWGKAPSDMIVYTGTDSTHAHLLRNSTLVKHPAYMSTSLSLKKAVSFATGKAGDVIAVHVPANHAGLYMPHLSRIPSEREFLLPRGLVLRMHPENRQVVSKSRDGDIILHHATIAGR